jgi:thiamine kinase-like enzyme
MDQLRQAITRVFGPAVEASLRPVQETPENRSWYVELPGVRCIARLPERHGGLTIEPEIEYELLRVTAQANLAPQPLAQDVPTRIIFVEQLENAVELSAEQARAQTLITQVAESLRALHALPAPQALRAFDAVRFAEAYCTAVTGSASRRAGALVYEIGQIASQYELTVTGSSLCHNDLHTGNLLLDAQLWFVDFEYAVLADPIVDIASYAAFNRLDFDTSMQLAHAYAVGRDRPSAEDLKAVIRIQQILGELWEMARSDNNARS